jgi:hypothetical protein
MARAPYTYYKLKIINYVIHFSTQFSLLQISTVLDKHDITLKFSTAVFLNPNVRKK